MPPSSVNAYGVTARKGRGNPVVRPVCDAYAKAVKFGVCVRFKPNDTLFNFGSDAQYTYKLVSGSVRLARLTRDGRRAIGEFALAGDLIGFDFGPQYGFTAEAIDDVIATRYSRTEMERAVDTEPELRKSLISALRRGLCDAQQHLLILTGQAAIERVASFILVLAKRMDARNGDAVPIPMRRQDIAEYLGLTTETVCRAISEFRHKGVIATPKRRQFIIHDMAALETLSGTQDS